MNNQNQEDKQLDFFGEDDAAKEVASKLTEDIKKSLESDQDKQDTNARDDQEEEAKEPVEMVRTERGEEFTKEEWGKPIFQDGPTRQEVEEWKDKFGSIYFTPFDGEYYIWRTLSRPEYREAVSNQEMTLLDREELFTDKCVLFPRNYETAKITKGKAGIPSVLTEMIMDKSGFVAQSAPIKL